MNMGCFPSHEVTTTTFDDNQNHDDGTTNDVNNNNNNTTATIAPATTNAAATTTATGTSLEVVLSSSSDPHVTSHKNTSVASSDHTIPLPVTIQATNTTSTAIAAAAVSSITVATITSTTTEPIQIKPDPPSSQQPPPPHTSTTTNTNTKNDNINTTNNNNNNNKKSKSDGDLLETPVSSTTDGNAQHRPASAPATTTKPTLHFVNKLSPSVAHSSLAPQRAGDDHHHHPTNTAGNHDGTTAAATAHTLPDNSHQSDNTDTTGDTNTPNRLFQKMTEGGEEAIHHLRNIFATPISFAVHAMSRGLPQLHNANHPNNYTMPNYPKTDYERNFLQKVLQKHYLFDSQSVSSLQKLINAFEICTIDVQDPKAIPVHDDMTNTTQYHVNIIQQGEEVMTHPNNNAISNAYFYVVYYGKCQFCVDDTVVGYANPGDAFGELALLYNGPRAATVTAILQEQVDMDDTNSMVVVDDHNEVDADHDADEKEEDHENDTTAIRGGKRPTSHVVSSTVSDIASISGMELGSNPKTNVVDDNMDDVVTVTAPLPPPPFPDYTVVLFRVHQRSFRIILQQDDQDTNDVTMNLLNNIEFLQNVPLSVKENLARVMVPFPFNKGDHILQKGIMDCPWYVIERGTVLASNLEHGYQDFCFHEGQCFGERAIMADAPAIGDVYAETAGVGFTVDHDTFKTLIGNVLGSNTNIISRQQDVAKLKGIGILSSATQTDHRVLNYLSKQITDQTFPVGAIICRVGEPLIHPPSLYLVRNGKVRLDYVDQEPIYIVMDAYFGEDQLQSDMAGKDRKGTYISEMAGKDRKGTYISPYTATVVEECTCGTLKLRDCRNVIDTRRMGEEDNILEFDSLSLNREIDKGIKMKDLSVHRMIGAGTFGQVFLVSRSTADGPERVYALKVQSKYELCQSGQAKGVVREKNLMTLFHHPFVARLLAAFQDEKCVYMVMNLLQGGELYSIMHTKTSNVLPEKSAKFYIACVAEALFYLHCSHSLVFRDLKPENVMIDDQGYAILIDFGFCKKISGKTYTTCGTPLYLAPEVILNRGHSWSVDYWSLGIMIYEMLVGHTPFYEHGMNKAELFQNIIRGKVYPPTDVSPEVLSLLSGLLRRDPAKRLGSLIGNENDIIDHPWFSEIDRDRLFLKELDAPFLPKIKDPFDSSNFSSWKHVDDKRFVRYPALSPDDEVIFKDF